MANNGENTVVDCYDFFDRVFPECGLLDLTDGIYNGDSGLPHSVAQANQHTWLLDQVGCTRGSHLLDIGCGYGTLLASAERRGATAVGITISEPQARHCQENGLDVRVMDYRAIDHEWDGAFDAIIANGSIEHFVQPADALDGRANDIYRGLFELASRLLDPASPSGRVATTVIHFHEYHPDPADLLKSPLTFRPFSDEFHSAILESSMGGFYPDEGQLERCAERFFRLLIEVDGTDDYRVTSEEWLNRARRCFLKKETAPRATNRVLSFAVRHPSQALYSLALLLTASWQWQFRGPTQRTRLLRQVWERLDPP